MWHFIYLYIYFVLIFFLTENCVQSSYFTIYEYIFRGPLCQLTYSELYINNINVGANQYKATNEIFLIYLEYCIQIQCVNATEGQVRVCACVCCSLIYYVLSLSLSVPIYISQHSLACIYRDKWAVILLSKQFIKSF